MPTYVQVAERLLEHLCRGLDLDESYEDFRSAQERFLDGWGQREVPDRVPYCSSIGDDHSPLEYSVAFGRQTEIRLLVEAQAEKPSAFANQHAALELNAQLAQTFGADFERFELIRDLFLPEVAGPPFSLWHAVCLDADGQHDFKVYLNPRAQGADRAAEVVGTALDRLGLSEANATLEAITSGEHGAATFNYFSLDLSNAASARVKVYFQHLEATAEQLDDAFKICPNHVVGDVAEFCRTVAGGTGPFRQKPITSCFSFVQGRAQPTGATFHFPIAHYVPDDQVTVERVAAYMSSQNIDAEGYLRMMQAFAMRPLQDAAGIQSYASFRREPAGIRLTAYMSPELFRGAKQASIHMLKKTTPSSAPQAPTSARGRR